MFGALNNSQFTDNKNSIGAIYIIRDPRNVITSLKNHYELDDDEALKWMVNKENYIYEIENFEKDGYGNFQFIGSWNMNYKSWKIQKKIPIKIIKYEDLLNETFVVFKDIVKFINTVTLNKQKIELNKLKNSVRTTFFDKLKDDEEKNGFSESVVSKKNKKKFLFSILVPRIIGKKFYLKNYKLKFMILLKMNLKNWVMSRLSKFISY